MVAAQQGWLAYTAKGRNNPCIYDPGSSRRRYTFPGGMRTFLRTLSANSTVTIVLADFASAAMKIVRVCRGQ